MHKNYGNETKLSEKKSKQRTVQAQNSLANLLKFVEKLCYSCDTIGATGSVTDSVLGGEGNRWSKFRDLLLLHFCTLVRRMCRVRPEERMSAVEVTNKLKPSTTKGCLQNRRLLQLCYLERIEGEYPHSKYRQFEVQLEDKQGQHEGK